MQVGQLRERKGTLVSDHNSRLEIIEDSLPPSHAEVEIKVFLSRHSTHSSSSGLKFPHHQAFHVISVMECHVMSCHMPQRYGGLCNSCFKMYCKVKVQRTYMEYAQSWKVENLWK